MPVKDDKEVTLCKQDESMSKELKNSLHKAELLLQEAKIDLMKKTEILKERDAQLVDMKKDLDEIQKKSSHNSGELIKTKAELDQAKSQIEIFGR